ncbi:hypothetical protein L8106_03454 [Lyngbya sp. PCC 8106]|nr:hypothetical protein L8106_03454 [Lyngbya sp. PCC 8106]
MNQFEQLYVLRIKQIDSHEGRSDHVHL